MKDRLFQKAERFCEVRGYSAGWVMPFAEFADDILREAWATYFIGDNTPFIPSTPPAQPKVGYYCELCGVSTCSCEHWHYDLVGMQAPASSAAPSERELLFEKTLEPLKAILEDLRPGTAGAVTTLMRNAYDLGAQAHRSMLDRYAETEHKLRKRITELEVAAPQNDRAQAVERLAKSIIMAAAPPAPGREPDWLTIATALCLKCDISHNGEMVLGGELANFMRDVNEQCKIPLPMCDSGASVPAHCTHPSRKGENCEECNHAR